MDEVVWLHEYRCFGFLQQLNAYQSVVLVQKGEKDWESLVVENDEYDLWEERAIEHESDWG